MHGLLLSEMPNAGEGDPFLLEGVSQWNQHLWDIYSRYFWYATNVSDGNTTLSFIVALGSGLMWQWGLQTENNCAPFGMDKYVSANWTVSDILTKKMVTPSCQYSHTLLGENNRGIEQCKILQQDASELFFFSWRMWVFKKTDMSGERTAPPFNRCNVCCAVTPISYLIAWLPVWF